MGHKTTQDGERAEPEAKKLDLSAAQVAGSSLATVAAALLASQLGVYGTILGAGVVSVVATAGGPVIQHFFRRTGDQLRGAARPRARQVPAAEPGPPAEEFGEATVHGTRVRGWKRTAAAAGAAFVISLGALGTYEAVAGTSVSSGGGTIFSGGTRTVHQDRPVPSGEQPDGGTGPGTGEKGGRSPGSGSSPEPSGSPDGAGRGTPAPGGSPSGEPSPGHTPSQSPSPSTSPPASPSAPVPDASTPGSGGTGGGGTGGSGGGQEQRETP